MYTSKLFDKQNINSRVGIFKYYDHPNQQRWKRPWLRTASADIDCGCRRVKLTSTRITRNNNNIFLTTSWTNRHSPGYGATAVTNGSVTVNHVTGIHVVACRTWGTRVCAQQPLCAASYSVSTRKNCRCSTNAVIKSWARNPRRSTLTRRCRSHDVYVGESVVCGSSPVL